MLLFFSNGGVGGGGGGGKGGGGDGLSIGFFLADIDVVDDGFFAISVVLIIYMFEMEL